MKKENNIDLFFCKSEKEYTLYLYENIASVWEFQRRKITDFLGMCYLTALTVGIVAYPR